MNFSKLTLLSALVLGTLTYCGSGEEKHSAETMEEHGMEHDQGMQMDEMEHSTPTSELSRINDMSREDYTTYAKMSDVPQVKASAEAKQQVSGITKDYLKIKDALVSGDQNKASEAAKSMNKQLNAFNSSSLEEELQDVYSSRADKLKKDAQAISSAANIAEQRAYLVSLSRNIAELNQAFNTDEKLYVQYCPMAFDNQGADWLSNEEGIRNPYFGDKMMKCGTVKRSVE